MSMEAFFQKTRSLIETHGFTIIATETHPEHTGHQTAYAYTVGLTAHGHPELLMVGLPPEMMQQLLHDMGKAVVDGRVYHHGERVEKIVKTFSLGIVAVPADVFTDYVGVAAHMAEASSVRGQQVLIPDPSGILPWDERCDPAYIAMQSRLFGESLIQSGRDVH